VEGSSEFGNFAELHVESSVAVDSRDCFQSCVVVALL